MKLNYWIAESLDDSACYSIIARTKKDVIAKLAALSDPDSYGPVEKRTIEYADAFDLFDKVTGESGGRNY